MIKVGVFLSRFQPFHNGHLHMIRLALKENEKVIIVIGSSNKKGTERNPFSWYWRKDWIQCVLTEEEKKRVEFVCLPDWSMESDKSEITRWGYYFYYNIVSRIAQKSFTMYCGEEDRTIIKKWFDDEDLKANITLRAVSRSTVFEGLSATKIRQAVLNGDMNYLKHHLPECVYDDYEYMLECITKSLSKEDYCMK